MSSKDKISIVSDQKGQIFNNINDQLALQTWHIFVIHNKLGLLLTSNYIR